MPENGDGPHYIDDAEREAAFRALVKAKVDELLPDLKDKALPGVDIDELTDETAHEIFTEMESDPLPKKE